MPASAPEIAVVVATRNRAEQLAELLDGLCAQTLAAERFEVMVVDDASDPTAATVLEHHPASETLALRWIRSEVQAGPASARDRGWRATTAEVIAFTDDDCVPEPTWLEAGLAAIRANPGTFVQGRTSPRPDQLDRRGPFSRIGNVQSLDPTFPATNIFYPRELLEAVDGFDLAAFDGGEDQDLAWRVLGEGGSAVYCADASVHHAVDNLGLRGLLSVAARRTAVLPYARHKGIRQQHFVAGVFRKRTHLTLVWALLGVLAGRRSRGLSLALAIPYLRSVRGRAIEDRARTVHLAFYLAYDLVEIWATVVGGARSGRPMI